MKQQQQQQEIKMKDGFNIFYGIVTCQALGTMMLTRLKLGPGTMGLPLAGAFVAFSFWVIGTASFELEMLMFLWFIAVLVQRGHLMIDQLQGVWRHSGDPGYPILTGWLTSNRMLARLMEGALIVVAGVLIEPVSWPIGHFLMASGGSIIFLEGVHRQHHHQRQQSTRDSIIEMEAMGNPLTGRVYR